VSHSLSIILLMPFLAPLISSTVGCFDLQTYFSPVPDVSFNSVYAEPDKYVVGWRCLGRLHVLIVMGLLPVTLCIVTVYDFDVTIFSLAGIGEIPLSGKRCSPKWHSKPGCAPAPTACGTTP
jgi:hypothetical protein